MSKREKLRKIKKEEKVAKLERNLYFISGILFLTTIIINILNIIYYPYLLNGLILEINIFMICICMYLFIKKQKKITKLEDEKLELKIKYILMKN
jgi:thiamine transporter ThiT